MYKFYNVDRYYSCRMQGTDLVVMVAKTAMEIKYSSYHSKKRLHIGLVIFTLEGVQILVHSFDAVFSRASKLYCRVHDFNGKVKEVPCQVIQKVACISA